MGEKEKTSKTKIEPNKFFKQFGQESLQGLQDWYRNYRDTPYFVAPETASARGMVRGLAGGSTIPGAANQYLTEELSGANVDPTKDPRFANAMADIEGRVSSDFGGGNRIGSGAHRGAMAERLGAGAANLYQQAQQRRLGAAALAPSVESLRYAPAGALAGVGAAEERDYQMDEGGGQALGYLSTYGQGVNASPYANYTQQHTPYYSNPALQWFGAGTSLVGALPGGGGGVAPAAGHASAVQNAMQPYNPAASAPGLFGSGALTFGY